MHGCMATPTLIDLNLVELKYYPFMISLDKCSGSCNILSPQICVPKKTKDINIKVFNMIKIKIMLKQWRNIFLVIANVNSMVQHVTHIKNVVRKHININVKSTVSAKKIIIGILPHEFERIASI